MQAGIYCVNMYFEEIAPWENYPKNLNFKEIQNPLLVLDEFFGDWMETHIEQLSKWRKYVLSGKVYRDKRQGPGSLVFTSVQNLRLLEACYLLLYSYHYTYGKQNRVTAQTLETGREQWAYFPNNLSEVELLNPYKVLKNMFKKVGPEDYRINLKEWLYFALYPQPIDEGELSLSIADVYDSMRKLYSAAWVIHQVEGKQPLLKAEFRKTRPSEKEKQGGLNNENTIDYDNQTSSGHLIIEPKNGDPPTPSH
jgi:hypothetical protein